MLGKSEKPLSSRDIEKEILGPEKVNKKKRDPDVYRVIEDKLCIQKFNHQFFLFDWDDLLSSIGTDKEYTTSKKRIQSKVIENLNRIGMGLIDYDYDRIKIGKEDHDSVITITAPRRSNAAESGSIKIKIHKVSKDYATLTIFDYDGKKRQIMPTSLTIKKVGRKKQQVFYEGFQGNPYRLGTSYLNTSVNEKAGKKSEAIKSINPDLFNCSNEVKKITTKPESDPPLLIPVVSEIESNRRNWEYSMNIRGLILYILGIINEGRIRNIEVSSVLQNLSENYKDEFPFLIHYKEIKELYDKLAVEKGMPEYEHFQVQLIRQIALELQYSIDTINKKELDYYITKRYSEDLTWYYRVPLKISVSPLPKVIHEYYVYTQESIKNYLEKELQDTKSRIDCIFALNKQNREEQIQDFHATRLIDNFSSYACPNFTVLLFGLTCYF